MTNIIVTNISTLPGKKTVRDYNIRLPFDSEQSSLQAIHTNESILKCIVRLKSVKETGGIGKIVALVSNQVINTKSDLFGGITALEYYQQVIKDCGYDIHPILIPIEREDDSECSNAEIIDNLCKHIADNDVVYIDSAGGKRTTSNVIQLLAKILRYKGIQTPCSLYSDIQNKQNFIVDTHEFDVMSSLADAFNEFMTTGKADQLSKCIETSNSKEYVSLVKSMSEFSDMIRLGVVDKLGDTIKRLQKQIVACKEINTDSIETVVLKQFLSVIEKKLIGENKVDYAKIISWCLENMLIQQALTVFVEKIPVMLFNEGILYVENIHRVKTEYAKTRNKMNPVDWETYAFYTILYDTVDSKNNHNDKVYDLKRYLHGDDTNVNMEIKESANNILCFNTPKLTPNKRNPITDILKEYIKTNKFRTFQSFINSVCNNQIILEIVLGVRKDLSKDIAKTEDKEDDTLVKKFKALQQIEDSKHLSCPIAINVELQLLLQIMYAYLYVKALRNQINHASAEENLTEMQKNVLARRGYDFSNFSLETVQTNIQIALDTVNKAVRMVPNKPHDKSVVYAAKYKEGDVVEARCIAPKQCVIKGCDYIIQLIVPKLIDINSLINKEFMVEIKQLSSNNKIIQAKVKNKDEEKGEEWKW